MRVATWNVNSVKQRVPRLLPWLDQRRPDVVCLQETKLADPAFEGLLGEELSRRHYELALHGEAQWNGVAILSRVGLDDVQRGIDGVPGAARREARAVSATCGGVRIHSIYVPNGRTPGSDHYHYKLAWLHALRERLLAGDGARAGDRQGEGAGGGEGHGAGHGEGGGHRQGEGGGGGAGYGEGHGAGDGAAAAGVATIVCGDVNIAPTDLDVFDPDAYIGQTHVTPPEREALAELVALGLRDVVRDRWPEERVFTYWDYRAGMFHQDLGMRIDLVLATAPVADRVRAAWVDRQARKGSRPSDHAPVIVDLDEAPDGDIGPVVPPPSAPLRKRGSHTLPQSR